jgi:hypothetical protein
MFEFPMFNHLRTGDFCLGLGGSETHFHETEWRHRAGFILEGMATSQRDAAAEMEHRVVKLQIVPSHVPAARKAR